jgi:hypothetical protein
MLRSGTVVYVGEFLSPGRVGVLRSAIQAFSTCIKYATGKHFYNIKHRLSENLHIIPLTIHCYYYSKNTLFREKKHSAKLEKCGCLNLELTKKMYTSHSS